MGSKIATLDIFIEHLESKKAALEIGETILSELNSGGGNYLKSRKQIAELSGLPCMAVTWDEHIEEIRRKLKEKQS
jgi:hypothetical protein